MSVDDYGPLEMALKRAERAEALVERLREHMLDAVVVFGLEGTKWDEVRKQLEADPVGARLSGFLCIHGLDTCDACGGQGC